MLLNVDFTVPLLVDDKSLGKTFATIGLTTGSEAQMIPVYTSMLDHMEAPMLSSSIKVSILFIGHKNGNKILTGRILGYGYHVETLKSEDAYKADTVK